MGHLPKAIQLLQLFPNFKFLGLSLKIFKNFGQILKALQLNLEFF